MGQLPLDARTCRDIDKVTWRVLRDAGISGPPVPVLQIAEHLKLYQEFYDLQDPSLLDSIKHKVVIGGRRLVKIVRKVRLVAVLFYAENRILMDSTLPAVKHDWTTCHEVGHKLVPWHKPYFRGDTAQTLDPDWHERLEAEANYAASELMFCGQVFHSEALDVAPTWQGFMQLQKRYGKSMTATLRRFVEHGPDKALAMLSNTARWQDKPPDQPERWRQFAASPGFQAGFGRVGPERLLDEVDAHARRRSGGPAGEFTFCLEDDAGTLHEVYAETFNNTHYLLTLFRDLGEWPARRIVVPGQSLA